MVRNVAAAQTEMTVVVIEWTESCRGWSHLTGRWLGPSFASSCHVVVVEAAAWREPHSSRPLRVPHWRMQSRANSRLLVADFPVFRGAATLPQGLPPSPRAPNERANRALPTCLVDESPRFEQDKGRLRFFSHLHRCLHDRVHHFKHVGQRTVAAHIDDNETRSLQAHKGTQPSVGVRFSEHIKLVKTRRRQRASAVLDTLSRVIDSNVLLACAPGA